MLREVNCSPYPTIYLHSSSFPYFSTTEKCPTTYDSAPDMDPECSVMEGRLTLYLVDKSYASEMTQLAREYIKVMMNDGLLDNASPAILGVTFIDDQVRGFVDPRDIIMSEDDDLEDSDVTIFTVGRNMWIAIGGSLIGIAMIGSALRYRYASQFDDHGDHIGRGRDDEPSENYSELRPETLQNDIETPQVIEDNSDHQETKVTSDRSFAEIIPSSAQNDTESAQVFEGDESVRLEVGVEANGNPDENNSHRIESEAESDESHDEILPALPASLLNETERSLIFDVFDIIDENADHIVLEQYDQYSC